MLKLVWLSDPHFMAEGDVLGHDPRVRLRAAVSHVNAHHRDAECCVISGDMGDRGTEADYAALVEILETLKILYFPMIQPKMLSSSIWTFRKIGCDAGEFFEKQSEATLMPTQGLIHNAAVAGRHQHKQTSPRSRPDAAHPQRTASSCRNGRRTRLHPCGQAAGRVRLQPRLP